MSVLSLGALSVHAGTITGSGPIVGPGLGTASVVTVTNPAPNNDNSAGLSPNQVIIDKRFDHVAPIDIVFEVTNSSGTTEYHFDEFVTNNTGVDWRDYHLQLGYGTGGMFVPSGLTDFLDFDAPDRDPAPSSPAFTLTTHGANQLDWDGTLAAGASTNFDLSVDVPDSTDIPDEYHTPTGYRFTLRQWPTIPEPGTLVLLACSSLLTIRRRS